MGAEFLPTLRNGEVKIARRSLASVTADQISVRVKLAQYGDEQFRLWGRTPLLLTTVEERLKPVRLAKVSLIALIGLYALLVGYNDIVDYGSNYEFVRHVFRMGQEPHSASRSPLAQPG